MLTNRQLTGVSKCHLIQQLISLSQHLRISKAQAATSVAETPAAPLLVLLQMHLQLTYLYLHNTAQTTPLQFRSNLLPPNIAMSC